MRLFMVVSAVWFFRIGLMFWFLATGGIGIDTETFEGPFLTFMYFGQMFIPLLFLEIYFRAQDSEKAGPKICSGKSCSDRPPALRPSAFLPRPWACGCRACSGCMAA